MAIDTPVNSQITDAVTQTAVQVIGEAPALALGVLYQSVAHSISLAMQNAQQAQAGLQQIGNAATACAVAKLLGGSQ